MLRKVLVYDIHRISSRGESPGFRVAVRVSGFRSILNLNVSFVANNMYKRMCFKCNMPHECATGFCYGDYCVKSICKLKF